MLSQHGCEKVLVLTWFVNAYNDISHTVFLLVCSLDEDETAGCLLVSSTQLRQTSEAATDCASSSFQGFCPSNLPSVVYEFNSRALSKCTDTRT